MKDIPTNLEGAALKRLTAAKKFTLDAGARALAIQRSGILEVEQKSLGALGIL